MDRLNFMLGSFFGFLGVALGAFGAHGLKKYFGTWPDMQPIFKTAVDYQMFHALALLATGWASGRWPNAWITTAGWLFVSGMALFCGSLYVLSLTRVKTWGAVAPIGGLALLAAWVCLFVGAWKGGKAG